MNQGKLNLFQQFYMSISGSYKELAKQTFGKALVYLLVLGMVLGVVHAGKFFVEGQHQVRMMAKVFAKQCPDFTLANGRLTVDAEKPIVLESKDSIVVIDTTGESDESILDDYEKGVFIDAERMINKKNSFTKQELLFSELKELSFTKKDVLSWMPWLDLFLVLIAIFVIVWFIGAKIVYALFLSLAGLILNSIYKTKMLYNNILAICLYALSFPMILLTIKIFVPGGIPFFFLFYLALAVVYVWIGIRAAKSNAIDAESLGPPMNPTLSE